jgi:tRNA(fMet)-specific endonuclease VapC
MYGTISHCRNPGALPARRDSYLLDTNAWIHYLKHADSPIRGRLAALEPADVVTCSIARSELLHGARKYGNPDRRLAIVSQALAPFRSLPFDDADAVEYAQIRYALESAGLVIGPYDLQIAAICVRHGYTLVTSNVSEFSRVSGLTVEDWLATTG